MIEVQQTVAYMAGISAQVEGLMRRLASEEARRDEMRSSEVRRNGEQSGLSRDQGRVKPSSKGHSSHR